MAVADRLRGYIDRVREAEGRYDFAAGTTSSPFNAKTLLEMPEREFGETIDKLSPAELREVMEARIDNGDD